MVTMKTQRLFFDKQAVIDMVGKIKAKAMTKAGAFVRTSARQSIRKRNRPSEPGQPPSSHNGKLKDSIFFALDPQRADVVVGPEYRSDVLGTSPDQGTVAGALERGGTVTVRAHRGRGGRQRPAKTIKVSARPFMLPALEKEAPKFPELFGA